MQYQIVMTDKANEQLNDIIMYIAIDSKENARKYLDRLEEAIVKLEDFPLMGVNPKYSTLRRQGYLVLIVENHLIFYKVDQTKKKVIIYGIFNSKQEYKRLI